MDVRALSPEDHRVLEQVLGYLNFSSGAPDDKFLGNLSRIFERLSAESPADWKIVGQALRDRLGQVKQTSPTFRDASQAEAVLDLVFGHVLPGYLEFHRDLLFHQSDTNLFRPYFVGRLCEAVLKQGSPWEEKDRIAKAAIRLLNDYLGYRPAPALETRKTEPYPHEWVRPVPLYVRGAGVSFCPQRRVLEQALKLLEETDETLLRAAHFDPKKLDELALDPRAYDFDHPVNKRPNYHFGQWDPHHIDNAGYYRRFVVQQVTLDALMARLNEPGFDRAELEFEAASVLAGTILMASGISGSGPETHDSTVTLATLLTHIAAYRDAFYDRLLKKMAGPHGTRLREEAQVKQQPFGGARQHLNAQLARRRASQLEHVQLARVYAQMGYRNQATAEANVVPTASARMLCQIDCWLTEGEMAINDNRLHDALGLPGKMIELLRRAIECGAVIDPWCILGFDAQFSLFPALENSVLDHRAEELVAVVERVFALYGRIWSEAAASDDRAVCQRIAKEYRTTAEWWHQYAVHEVSAVGALDSLETYRAAQHVAEALNLWHKGGAAAGDVGFWASHAEMFDSPQSYALVTSALLDQGDFVGSMALLIHWLSEAEKVRLEQGESSFHALAERWMAELRHALMGSLPELGELPSDVTAVTKAWTQARKFLDYMEANADVYWEPPTFDLTAAAGPHREIEPAGAFADDDEDSGEELYSAAYEDMVYVDSTDDGVEGSLFDSGPQVTEDELERESERIADRLAFLASLARLWRTATLLPLAANHVPPDFTAIVRRWIERADANEAGLYALLDSVKAYRIPLGGADHEAMVEYDRRRWVKESLLERIIATSIDNANSRRILLAAVAVTDRETPEIDRRLRQLDADEYLAIEVLGGLLADDYDRIDDNWDDLQTALRRKALLYVPLAKGGEPRAIVAARTRQQTIQELLAWLPRLGLIIETCELIETARQMEQSNPVGVGAVTEFDELFKTGYKALIDVLVVSSQTWEPGQGEADDRAGALVNCIEQMTDAMLVSWLAHSRTLRLSVLERLNEKREEWDELVKFVKAYGADLFTQRFLNLGNLRAIMHQGVDAWLRQLEEHPSRDLDLKLLRELDKQVARPQAVEILSLILESLIENYGEYRDYNSTTTQSDRGEMLFMLLDFLRLRTKYDRVCWNLKPVVLAHEVLVRRGEEAAARMWRRALSDRVKKEADDYLAQLAKLQAKYAMRMPTVADRLNERFLRPMTIDRIRALVRPAIEQAATPGPFPAFSVLDQQVSELTREPSGAGLDLPVWLVALQEEVDRVSRPAYEEYLENELDSVIRTQPITYDEIRQQLDEWMGNE